MLELLLGAPHLGLARCSSASSAGHAVRRSARCTLLLARCALSARRRLARSSACDGERQLGLAAWRRSAIALRYAAQASWTTGLMHVAPVPAPARTRSPISDEDLDDLALDRRADARRPALVERQHAGRLELIPARHALRGLHDEAGLAGGGVGEGDGAVGRLRAGGFRRGRRRSAERVVGGQRDDRQHRASDQGRPEPGVATGRFRVHRTISSPRSSRASSAAAIASSLSCTASRRASTYTRSASTSTRMSVAPSRKADRAAVRTSSAGLSRSSSTRAASARPASRPRRTRPARPPARAPRRPPRRTGRPRGRRRRRRRPACSGRRAGWRS
ncbi:MAG: hypothetical protein MZV64_43290 [Ignavibacteriales bacterium]|nr:hypothetical protein [Ignavibacteriales bacterium]